MISSYSSIFNLGHKALDVLFDGEVLIEEKVDGSQFSFRKIRDTEEIEFRSRGREIFLPCTYKLFSNAIDYVLSVKDKLLSGYTYRGEVLAKPKHNTICYERVPKNNIVIFDIDFGDQRYLSHREKFMLAADIGLETVPLLFQGIIDDIESLRAFFERDSFLGGAKIEGIAIKNYNHFGPDKKTLMGKWVSEDFKEKHISNWKKTNPSNQDMIAKLIGTYRNENRWAKAVQHLKEDGELVHEPKDIGNLMKEVCLDVHKECEEEIKELLWKFAWPKISRGIVGGLPEWYKNKLAESQFKK